jgi:hypothetical protein
LRACRIKSRGYSHRQSPNRQSPEKEVIKACIQYLTLKGYEVIRNNTGAFVATGENGKKRLIRFGFPGSADIIACSPEGRFVAVECKSDSGRLTIAQQDFIRRVTDRNGIAVVARSVDDLVRAGL